jgi:hypothetical protein
MCEMTNRVSRSVLPICTVSTPGPVSCITACPYDTTTVKTSCVCWSIGRMYENYLLRMPENSGAFEGG